VKLQNYEKTAKQGGSNGHRHHLLQAPLIAPNPVVPASLFALPNTTTDGDNNGSDGDGAIFFPFPDTATRRFSQASSVIHRDRAQRLTIFGTRNAFSVPALLCLLE